LDTQQTALMLFLLDPSLSLLVFSLLFFSWLVIVLSLFLETTMLHFYYFIKFGIPNLDFMSMEKSYDKDQKPLRSNVTKGLSLQTE